MSSFNRWTAPRHIEKAIIDHLSKWVMEYFAEAERQFGLEPRTLPVPEAGQFTTVREQFEKWPEDQTPAVLVIAPGLAGTPRMEADRSLTAPVAIGVATIVGAPGWEPGVATEAAQIMGVALRELMLQLPPDGLDVDGVELRDERYGDVPADNERTMGSARIVMVYWVRNWAIRKGGPKDRVNPRANPYEDDGGDWPTVDPDKIFLNITRQDPEEGVT